MIKKLRRKLIVACMISLTIVLTVILGGVNLMNYQKVITDADTVLTLSLIHISLSPWISPTAP